MVLVCFGGVLVGVQFRPYPLCQKSTAAAVLFYNIRNYSQLVRNYLFKKVYLFLTHIAFISPQAIISPALPEGCV